jgi:hypothetical protein
MSLSLRRVGSHGVSLLAIAVSALAGYNVFADNTAVKEEAKRAASCEACDVVAEDRNPLRQELTVSKKGHPTLVRCARSLWLVGPYSCLVR